MGDMQKPLNRNARLVVRSRLFNADNGAATTLDDVLMKHSKAVRLLTARAVYTTETTGTIAAGTVSVGTTVGGVDVVAATNLENTKTVGTSTALVLAVNEIPAGTMLTARHTGVAAVAAGEYYVEIEYAVHE